MSSAGTHSAVRARAGSLAETPFERLLFDAFLAERTCALELRRRQIEKTVFLDRGFPTECASNLMHETLGQFLLNRERITNAEFKDCFSEAAARQLRIGEILLERKLLEPSELSDALKKNLAYKILECFTWTDGEFRIEPWMPEAGDVSVVEPTRVVFTGISKFVPQERVAAALGALLERPLAMTAQTRVDLRNLRMSPTQGRLLRKLRQPTDAHALFQDEATPRDELARTLYACSVMGLVALVDPGTEAVEPARPEATPEEEDEIAIDVDTSALEVEASPLEVEASPLEVAIEAPAPDAPALHDPEPWALRDEIAAEYRAYEGKSPHELFGLAASASAASMRSRYLGLCRRYAPEAFEHEALAPVAEMAAELLHAVTSAYEELRGRLPAVEIDPPAEAAPAECPSPPEISPDPRRMAGEYARQARERMASGNFAAATGLMNLALRSDPGNLTCRVELAYARFREMPGRAAEALAELEGLLNAAPKNVLARLYAAEVSHVAEDFERATEHFRAACELWERERA